MTRKNLNFTEQIGEIDAVSKALADIYTGVFLINIKTDQYTLIKSQKEILDLIGDISSAQQALDLAVKKTASTQDQKNMRAFVDLGTLSERMKSEKFLNREYLGTISGWVRGSFIEVARDEQGGLEQVLYAYQVIDEEKRLELDHQQALREACAAAERASVAKTAFLSHMTHDIRTPMNAILGMTTLAIQNLDDHHLKKVSDCLSKIHTSSQHLLALINEALDMGQIESGKLALNQKSFNLSAMVEGIKTVMADSVRAHQHEFQISTTGIVHDHVYGDETRLSKALINILSNAVKYTPDGGRVCMDITEKTTNKNDRVCFQFVIEDNGIGMSKEFLPRLFLPYEREDNPNTKVTQGNGLGMVITRNIIQLMNGNIEVDSTPGRGTRFTVTVFLQLDHDTDLQEDTMDQTKHALEELAALDYSDKKILLVEDNELNREVAAEIIKMTHAQLAFAENGKEALEMFESNPSGYDLIFMDIQMPVMNGYEATRAIRHSDNPYAKKIPIIAMSANAYAEDVIASRKSGMNDHIAKPLDLQRLGRLLQTWLAKESEKDR